MTAWLENVKMPRDPLGLALVAWKIALTVATTVTSIFSYLAARATETVNCADMHWIAGYRSGTLDFWALPLMSLAALLVLTTGANKRLISQLLEDYREPVARFGPIQITLAGRMVGFFVIIALAILWGVTVWAILRYSAVVHYCASSGGLH